MTFDPAVSGGAGKRQGALKEQDGTNPRPNYSCD